MKGRDKGDQATGLPACRAVTEPRPLATARAHRLERPARGTHQYLGRGARRPAVTGRGDRPGAFDPEKLSDAASRLTSSALPGGAVNQREHPLVPRVTLLEAYPSFRVDIVSLDFQGQKVVRPLPVEPTRSGSGTTASSRRRTPGTRGGPRPPRPGT